MITKALPTTIANNGNINIVTTNRSNADANAKVGGEAAVVCAYVATSTVSTHRCPQNYRRQLTAKSPVDDGAPYIQVIPKGNETVAIRPSQK
jgi:hypothetical protein